MKTCSRCHQEKPLSEFYRQVTSPSGRGSYCKPCSAAQKSDYWNRTPAYREKSNARRATWASNPEHQERIRDSRKRWRRRNPEYNRQAQIRHRYGKDAEAQYIALLEAQNGNCALCGKKPNHRLHIDHNHRTKEIRGLLCTRCNSLLGFADDSLDRLVAAAGYLTDPPARKASVTTP
jgi:NMD protein affecting ribosome stability and mRNA decay